MAVTKPLSPIINWRYPLTKGLVLDSPFFERGGANVTDLVRNAQGALVGATWDTNILGTDIDFSAASSIVSYTAVPTYLQSLTQMSLEFYVYFRSAGGGGLGRIVHKGNGTNGYFQVNTGHTAGNQLSFQTTRGTTSGIWDYNNALPSNTWVHVVITYDGTGSSTTNVPSVYLNGVFTAISATITPVGALIADDAGLYIGNRSGSARNWDGKIAYLRAWNRLLTATEARNLFVNPWQIYRTPNFTPFYVSPAAVVGSVFPATRMMMGFGM